MQQVTYNHQDNARLPNIHPATLKFLDAIAEKNTRAYFETVKPLYKEILASMTGLCQYIIDATGMLREDGSALTPKECLFRIYRDARRLKEGDPLYKHNFGFVVSPRGKKDTISGYYVHLEPGNCFFACGAYRPRSPELFNIRTSLKERGSEYVALIQDPKFITYFGGVSGNSLTRPPRGFSDDDPYIDLIKMKQHLVYKRYDDEDIFTDDFVHRLLEDISHAKARSDWLCEASG